MRIHEYIHWSGMGFMNIVWVLHTQEWQGRTATILLTSADPFESPVLGIVAGLGIIAVGIVTIWFARPISRFMSSTSVQLYGRKWADLLAKTQLVRLRAMGILMCVFGAAVLVIGAVSEQQGF